MDWSRLFSARVAVLGCGNQHVGDDAAGPRVVALLAADPDIPADVALLDVGTSIRTLLFDLVLSDSQPARVVLVDATTNGGRSPGEFWEIDVDGMDSRPVGELFLHTFPTLSLLRELRSSTGIQVRIVVVQAGFIPEGMEERLSPEVAAALPGLAGLVKRICLEP